MINGKLTECIVDTGCSGILWSSWLHLTGQRTGVQASIGDAAGNTATVQEAMLDSVQIGGLELRHIPSCAVTVGHSEGGNYPILGNSMFAHTVLTIDYVRQELIIRPSVENSTPTGVRDLRHIMNFQWISPDGLGGLGVPCVRGSVMSLPANITIDTGWVDNSVGLTSGFYKQLRPHLEADHIRSHKVITYFLLGMGNGVAIPYVSWSLGGIIGTNPAVVVDTLHGKDQATVGLEFLKSYRTTIDYPQQKLWFELIRADKGK